jgi:hypothetical protein
MVTRAFPKAQGSLSLLLLRLNSQFLSALGPSPVEYQSSPFGGHAHEKTVRPFSFGVGKIR